MLYLALADTDGPNLRNPRTNRAIEEHMNQKKMLTFQSHNMIRHEICDPISSEGSSPNDYNQGIAPKFMVSDGTGMLSRAGMGHVSRDTVPSLEQISSITACSIAEAYCDSGPCDGPNFLGNSLQYTSGSPSIISVQQKHLNEGEVNLIKHGGILGNHQNVESQKILESYMEYKREHVGGSPVSWGRHMHSTFCNDFTCNCNRYGALVSHYDTCQFWECPLCRPIRKLRFSGKHLHGSRKQESDLNGVFGARDFSCTSLESTDGILHPRKRLKTGSSISLEIGDSDEVASSKNRPFEPEHLTPLQQGPEAPLSHNVDATKIDMGMLSLISDSTSTGSSILKGTAQMFDLKITPSHTQEFIGFPKEEQTVPTCINKEGEVMNKSNEVKLGTKSELVSLGADLEMKLEAKIMSVSLIDCFTVEELKEHLFSLRKWNDQEIKGTTTANSIGENSCQLCAMNKLLFAPPPIYCSSCYNPIKRNLNYYCPPGERGNHQYCFCASCFKRCHDSAISVSGFSISKEKLHRVKNNVEYEEWWVECGKCKGWQHQICALYNDKRDLGGKAQYVCPKCCLEGIKIGEQVPLPKFAGFPAKDLPTTVLSNFIEQRLFKRLKQDREERAKVLRKKLEEVPEAADLVVRVVLSVNKLVKVKQQLLDTVGNENFPAEFPYKSKVILLFQKIEGVDVCLFGMYVQEFGSECGHPNKRSIYIAYLDSVKYFRPEIEAASGEALRTFVYHEILIGYLAYCKKRGFATCYIWSCPPRKAEDYIFNGHPENQKTPKSNKLRLWYKSVLNKAAKENIVGDCMNLYDHLFVDTGERNIKLTAARLPYFDGDYWSVAAVDMINELEQESGVGSQIEVKKSLSKRTLRAVGHTNVPGDATKDMLLMQKLGKRMSPVKEDFIMVHLQVTCTCCHEVILSDSRWCCNECKNFQLCVRCHDGKQHLNDRNSHTSGSGEKHCLSQVVVNGLPVNTEDPDVILHSDCFENRDSFLSLCLDNHYQFDTLRRAKHSSMMILYHLHNSTEPNVGTSCCICHQRIAVNHGWRCEICPRFDACDGCYQRKSGDFHIHKLSQHSSAVNSGSRKGHAQLQKHKLELLEILVHASQCKVTNGNPCSYPKCFQMKKLFLHAHRCKVRFAGGCLVCYKTWRLLKLHSETCRDSNCRVPRCLDIKRHTEMLALGS